METTKGRSSVEFAELALRGIAAGAEPHKVMLASIDGERREGCLGKQSIEDLGLELLVRESQR